MTENAGPGGNGTANSINGSSQTFGGGGGGGTHGYASAPFGQGGNGGGGPGMRDSGASNGTDGQGR